MLNRLKRKAIDLKKETYTLFLVYNSSKVAWWKRLFLGFVIGYALSPIDLIPDFIPILGYLDDLILVPLGISLALKLIPSEIYKECRERAMEDETHEIPIGKKTALIIVIIWIVGLFTVILWLLSLFKTLIGF